MSRKKEKLLLNVFGVGVVFCFLLLLFLLVIYILAVADQLTWLGKRDLVCLLSFTCKFWFLFREFSSAAGYLGWAVLFYFGTP